LDAGVGPDLNLIGRFGVGFHSSFLLKLSLALRNITTSHGCGRVSSLVTRETSLERRHGRVLRRAPLDGLVGRHSQFVAFPILIFVKRERSGSGGGHTNDQFFLDHTKPSREIFKGRS
jgi:HSP90 family molecular chaperone